MMRPEELFLRCPATLAFVQEQLAERGDQIVAGEWLVDKAARGARTACFALSTSPPAINASRMASGTSLASSWIRLAMSAVAQRIVQQDQVGENILGADRGEFGLSDPLNLVAIHLIAQRRVQLITNCLLFTHQQDAHRFVNAKLCHAIILHSSIYRTFLGRHSSLYIGYNYIAHGTHVLIDVRRKERRGSQRDAKEEINSFVLDLLAFLCVSLPLCAFVPLRQHSLVLRRCSVRNALQGENCTTKHRLHWLLL